MCKKLFFIMPALLLLFSVGQMAKADLVAYYPFDGDSGDYSGNGLDGIEVGDPTYEAGQIGQAVRLDGVDDYVDCGNPVEFQLPGPMTLMAWIKINVPGPSSMDALLAKGDNSYRIAQSRTAGTLEAAFGGLSVEGTSWGNITSVTLVDDRQWHHVAATYDGAAIAMYIDGVLDVSAGATGSITNSTYNLWIGNNSGSTSRYWDGWIDDVQIYNEALTQADIQDLMGGVSLGPVYTASRPKPEDGEVEIRLNQILSWKAGETAAVHDVYFGTDLDDVSDANRSDPRGVLVSQGQTGTTFDPELNYARTYNWRIDEVNDLDPNAPYKGKVWSFRTEEMAYLITSDKIIVTTSSVNRSQVGEKTIDGSGLVGNLHSNDAFDSWLSQPGGPGSAWIQYEFDMAYKIYEMYVWNYNAASPRTAYGFKGVLFEYSTDGENWTRLDSVTELAEASGTSDYAPIILAPGVVAKYIRLTANSNWGGDDGLYDRFGLSEVRFYWKDVWPTEFSPESGTTGLDVAVSFSWKPGKEAAGHRLYLSEDKQAVIDGNVPPINLNQPSYSASLPMGTYYWRAVDVNNAETPTSWSSELLDFSTVEYFVVEGFEVYTDEPGSTLPDTWRDGRSDPSNGAFVGYPDPDLDAGEHYAETIHAHSGSQSMPFFFDNTRVWNTSEIRVNLRDIDGATTDWTKGAPEFLVFWIFGDPDNTTTERMYIKVDGARYWVDIDSRDLQKRWWTQVRIDLRQMDSASAVNLRRVGELRIGFERNNWRSGTGLLLIDDIRLYRMAPPIPVPVNPGNDALIAYYAMQNNVEDSSGNGLDGTPMSTDPNVVSDPNFVSGPSGYGQALYLDGNDEYIDLGMQEAFNPAGSFSISLWVNIEKWSVRYGHPMIANRGDSLGGWGSPSVGWQLRRSRDDGLRFTTRGTGNDDMSSSTNMPLNEWIHLVCVYDNVNNTKTIYLNGTLNSQGATNPGGAIAPTTHNTYIGVKANADNTGVESESRGDSQLFGGMLDEIRLYNKALSADEARYLANPK